MRFSVLFLASILSSAAFASEPATVQYIDCITGESVDHVIVSLQAGDFAKGTLFISSGITDEGQESSGTLLLAKLETRGTNAVYRAENTISTFDVILPLANVGVSSNDVQLRLEAKTKNGQHDAASDFYCFSRMY